MSTVPPTMFQWMFGPAARWLHASVGGFVLAALAPDVIHAIQPTPGVMSAVAGILAIVLALPLIVDQGRRHRRPQTVCAVFLAIAYVWMAALYFVNWSGFIQLPRGYDAITDIVSTGFFACAWATLTVLESDTQSRFVDRIAVAALVMAVLFAGLAKFHLDAKPDTPDDNAARLMLNLCNGAVFLSLYAQMRRVFSPPDPLSHLVILLYGCAQIAAHGADCVGLKTCHLPGAAAIAAFVIAWGLLLGKIAFAVYVAYFSFNVATLRSPRPRSSASNAGSARLGG
jgi:hypothetical protein